MNNYYILKIASGTEQTGTQFPQCQGMAEGYDYNGVNSYRKLRHDVFRNLKPDLDSFLLQKKAKLTDFVSKTNPYFGFLLNEKVKNIMQNYKLLPYRFYNASIKEKEMFYNDFFLFHFISDLSEFIDYTNTKFVVTDYIDIVEEFNTSSKSELYSKWKSTSSLYEFKVYQYQFITDFEIEFDLFKVSFTDPKTYISHRLKTALEEANITGIEIVPTDVI